MKKFVCLLALMVGACSYIPEGEKPQVNAQASAPITVATSAPNPCAESFNAALDQLVMAMETQGVQVNTLNAAYAQ